MTLYNGADGAFPGAPLPAGTSILAAYVGEPEDPGVPDTPHIWSGAEWNGYIEAQPDLRTLPIYTHNWPGDPVACAENAVNAVLELGWRPHIGRIIVVDLEILVDVPYVQALDHEIGIRGFRLMKYGSYSFVVQNGPVAGGTWAAALTRRPPSILPPDVNGIQWQFGTAWDRDVFGPFAYDNCGQGPRRVT